MNAANKFFWTVILLAFLITSSAQAGGLYLYELGTPDVGAAAAGWAARAQDASTVFTNPAGMTRLEKSQLLVGIQPIYLHAEFSPNADTSTSGSDGDASTWLPAGGLYYFHDLTPKLKLGLALPAILAWDWITKTTGWDAITFRKFYCRRWGSSRPWPTR